MPKILLTLCVIAAAVCAATLTFAKEDKPVVPLSYQAITQVTSNADWLNTSRALTVDDLKGRIILLDFWTYCCINCMQVMPDLKYLEDKFGDKLLVIGVHSAKFTNEKDTANIRSAILRHDLHHPVVNDADFLIWRSFGTRAWPTFMLIAPNGRLAADYSGEGHRAELERDINTLLETFPTVNTKPLPLKLEKDKRQVGLLDFPTKLDYAADIDGEPAIFITNTGKNTILATRLDGRVFMQIGSGTEGLKDGSFNAAQLRRPNGILYDGKGKLYIADSDNHALRVADLKAKTLTTLAGDGKRGEALTDYDVPATKLRPATPWDLAFYPDKSTIVLANAGTHQLWKYNIAKNTFSVLAGNGRESIDDGRYPFNSLSQPSGLSVLDGKLYFVDSETSSLRVLDDTKITTLIGTGLFDFGLQDGTQGKALMQHPIGLLATADGVYIADSYNQALRRYDVESGTLKTLLTNLREPNDILQVEDELYIADTNGHRIMKYNPATKQQSEFMLQTGQGTKAAKAAVEAPAKPASIKFSDFLPNVTTDQLSVESGKPITLALDLEKGWELNADAPSFAGLFQGKTALWQADKSQLLKSDEYKLPGITKPVRLQGTFYYCRSDHQSQCLIKSIDYTLAPGNFENNTLTVRLRP